MGETRLYRTHLRREVFPLPLRLQSKRPQETLAQGHDLVALVALGGPSRGRERVAARGYRRDALGGAVRTCLVVVAAADAVAAAVVAAVWARSREPTSRPQLPRRRAHDSLAGRQREPYDEKAPPRGLPRPHDDEVAPAEPVEVARGVLAERRRERVSRRARGIAAAAPTESHHAPPAPLAAFQPHAAEEIPALVHAARVAEKLHAVRGFPSRLEVLPGEDRREAERAVRGRRRRVGATRRALIGRRGRDAATADDRRQRRDRAPDAALDAAARRRRRDDGGRERERRRALSAAAGRALAAGGLASRAPLVHDDVPAPVRLQPRLERGRRAVAYGRREVPRGAADVAAAFAEAPPRRSARVVVVVAVVVVVVLFREVQRLRAPGRAARRVLCGRGVVRRARERVRDREDLAVSREPRPPRQRFAAVGIVVVVVARRRDAARRGRPRLVFAARRRRRLRGAAAVGRAARARGLVRALGRAVVRARPRGREASRRVHRGSFSLPCLTTTTTSRGRRRRRALAAYRARRRARPESPKV